MKIGYWLNNATVKLGGTGVYPWRVLEMLLKNFDSLNIDLIIFCSPESQANCVSLLQEYKVKANTHLIPKKFNSIDQTVTQAGRVLSKIAVKLKLPSIGVQYQSEWYRWFSRFDLDLVHIPYLIPPAYELPYPYVITMHDVQHIHFPEFFSPDRRAYRAEHYWKSLKNSSAVVVSFDHVKKDLIKYFFLPEKKIHVCPFPYDQIDLSVPTPEEKSVFEQKYSPLGDFIFYPAQFWEHKNHISLIKALELIRERNDRSINVVFTGKKNANLFSEIQSYLEQSSIVNHVHFLGLVPEEELYWLYKNCSLVIIPTLYEGIGLPLIEAMALGSPVVCSSVTNLPEIIDDPRFMFDPLNVEEMANLIIKMLDDSELRTANIANSEKRTIELREINSVDCFYELWKYTITHE